MNDRDNGPFGLALLLAWLAGWIDAAGYTRTGGVFLSFMSGNTTELGSSIAAQAWLQAGFVGGVIACFVGSVVLGSVLDRRSGAYGRPVILAIEALLLATGASLYPDRAFAWPLVLAMGFQTTTMQRAGGIAVGLTYVTGTLVQVGRSLASGAFRHASMFAGVWLALCVGAGCSVLMLSAAPRAALYAPAAVAALIAILTAQAMWRRQRLAPPPVRASAAAGVAQPAHRT